jgi:hypothetical protein
MNRLTTWSNDPVTGPPSEAIYLRDEVTGSSGPRRPGRGAAVGRCGATVRATRAQPPQSRADQELLLLVPPGAFVKLLQLKVRNPGAGPAVGGVRRQWVTGAPAQAPQQVVCSQTRRAAPAGPERLGQEFADRVAFAGVSFARTPSPPTHRVLGRNVRPPPRPPWPAKCQAAARPWTRIAAIRVESGTPAG